MWDSDVGSHKKKAARHREAPSRGSSELQRDELLKWWGGTAFNSNHRTDR
jgi:hypothetical protein